ncbi:hypothetical protein, partial [Winkia sp. UMB3105]|uniref:hypothetical protein n=2 Tax=unclassified Winkia TaxID=2692119 RepID=UPI0025550136
QLRKAHTQKRAKTKTHYREQKQPHHTNPKTQVRGRVEPVDHRRNEKYFRQDCHPNANQFAVTLHTHFPQQSVKG